jgi:hypothetical protein
VKHLFSTSLRFPFAYLANRRRKLALSPGYINDPHHLPPNMYPSAAQTQTGPSQAG